MYNRYDSKLSYSLTLWLHQYCKAYQYLLHNWRSKFDLCMVTFEKTIRAKREHETRFAASQVRSLCPLFDTELEQFFNHIKYVKINRWHLLFKENLNDFMLIKIFSDMISAEWFIETMSSCCIDNWYNKNLR